MTCRDGSNMAFFYYKDGDFTLEVESFVPRYIRVGGSFKINIRGRCAYWLAQALPGGSSSTLSFGQ